MNDTASTVHILASDVDAPRLSRLSRRGFLGAIGLAGISAAAVACGSRGSSSTAASATGGPLEKALHIYTWSDYHSPDILDAFRQRNGITLTVDSYASNEEMIAKLVAARGTSGYDIVIPSGTHMPQMIENGLLAPLNKSLIPNLSHVDPQFLGRSWDPDNKYSICKDWGTTGYVYDKNVIKRELTTWADFLDAAQNEASRKTSILDDPGEITGPYFWANGIDWNTTDSKDLDAAEQFVVTKLAPNVAAFDSSPGTSALPQATQVLYQAYNGDARKGIAASRDPNRWQWVFPGPKTELWMDNWAILAGAPHPEAAHSFINTVLDPANALIELEYLGYHTGTAGIEKAALAKGIDRPEMIFFTPQQVATMQDGEVNEAQQRHVDIWNKAKAAAGA